MIPYGRQDINQEDIDAVVDVLQSDFLTQGPCVPKFESAVAGYCGVAHAIAVNSATSALHIACLALGLQKGDILWTSPITFVASSNAGLYCGAEVDFVDIDPITCNMSVSALKQKLDQAAAQNRLPKIVVPVHLSGLSADMAAIAALGREYGFRIIEDASHAIGGRYGDQPVGSCQYSDITVFSFHPVKIITTGEGGMALTNDAGLAQSMQLLRSHGITRDTALYEGPNEGPWYYQQLELGFNYRMTDICAALGLSQMSRLDTFVSARAKLADRYDSLLQSTGLILQGRSSEASSAHHLYVVRLPQNLESSHLSIFNALRGAGIGVNLHYIPVYRHPYYRKLRSDWGDFPQSEAYYRSAISLPLFATLTIQDQNTVVAALNGLLN
ncbi:MAG: UDP-4-amino-4,6-dideoxy-N-acetyl-beta-L-altrosamine transaminase [Rhodobacteraceae bacterium]|nr:UDP-4-amino-4,6-dideoxy-N-acetyl-beta-L-altrosamine transaminase [Paracoccaceae bacterium]MCZ8082028.1 UDP-4-amino-4,6-dideoxy-N-acetyl-beta-L-altrosamine transaminase [Paracoccaceae bacterium]